MTEQIIPLETKPEEEIPFGRPLARRYRSQRRPRVRLLLAQGIVYCLAEVHDVSTEGIGLLLDRPLPIDTPMTIQAGSLLPARSGTLSGTVRHATLQSSGLWLLGCKLARHLSCEELSALI